VAFGNEIYKLILNCHFHYEYTSAKFLCVVLFTITTFFLWSGAQHKSALFGIQLMITMNICVLQKYVFEQPIIRMLQFISVFAVLNVLIFMTGKKFCLGMKIQW
jgi:hypothetical protein